MSPPATEPAVQEAQRSILRDVVRTALPTAMGMATVTLTTSIATGMFEALWSRGVPSLVLLGFAGLAWVDARRGRFERALGLIISGVAVVVLIALTFNGGVRAPAAMLLAWLVSLCGWIFGRRGASVMLLISFTLTTLAFLLGVTKVLPEPPALPLVGQYVMLLVLSGLMWTTSASPPERLRAALLEATVRERELKAEQERRLQFQAVYEQTSYLVALISPEGVLQSANRAALDFVGLASAELVVGQRFSQAPWWGEANRAPLEERIARVREGQGVQRFDSTLVDAQGRTRHLDVSLSPFRDAAGELKSLIAEGRDVTDAVLSRERLHTTRRLELVGQLAGGVAHDFNNVLMAILSSAELLRLDLGSAGVRSENIDDSLRTIAQSGQRASDLTRRLLSFGRRSSVEKRALSVHALLEATRKLLERTLPANVHVKCELHATADLVEGDLASLESALINLALNARDAMPGGGTLTFGTGQATLDADACRRSGFDVQPGAWLKVWVRDTGTGISPEHVARVFEPFFTTKPEGKGTGLGLASVFGVMREHQGMVHLESELGRGTTFELSLPLSSGVPAAELKPALERGFPGVRALVVDDEVALRATLPRLLGRMGITCTATGSAEEALRGFDPEMQLLVSDIVLPGRRGTELAAELLALHPRLKVLLISGFPKDSEVSALPADRVRMLAKPFGIAELQRALGELL